MSIELDLDVLQAMSDAATLGPWTARATSVQARHEAHVALAQYPRGASDDAGFIAAAREAVPALIARVRELERKNTQQGMLLAGLLSKSDRDDAHIAELEAQ